MTNDPFTPAFALFALLLALALAFLELIVLKRPAAARFDLLAVGAVNLIFIYILMACQNSYFAFLLFPLPVIPAFYVGLKGWAYYAVATRSSAPMRWPVTILLSTLLVHLFLSALAYTSFEAVNPTPTHMADAIRKRENVRLEAMLWLGFIPADTMFLLMNTAIHADNDDAVRRLIRRGADPDQRYDTPYARRPILWRIAKWRLNAGGQTAGHFEWYILMAAFRKGVPEMEDCLQHGLDLKPYPRILTAILDPDFLDQMEPEELPSLPARIAFLIAHGADLNAPDDGGLPPLFELILAKQHLPAVLKLLIEHGADINYRLGDTGYRREFLPPGMTPLMLASKQGAVEYVAILIEKGANRTLRDNAGHSALDFAHDPALVRLLF